jgi:hypothetical protein
MQNVVVMPAPKKRKGTTKSLKLTQDRVSRIPLAADGKAIAYLDTELKGFMVIAAKTAKATRFSVTSGAGPSRCSSAARTSLTRRTPEPRRRSCWPR